MSADCVTVFPMRSAKPREISSTRGSVCSAGMSSTSFMTGTGFMKWKPTTLAARSSPVFWLTAEAARVEMEMDEVLLARMACGGRWVARLEKMACLIGSDSETACQDGLRQLAQGSNHVDGQ